MFFGSLEPQDTFDFGTLKTVRLLLDAKLALEWDSNGIQMGLKLIAEHLNGT